MTDKRNNSGHRNSGDGNSGDWNSGDWNSGHRNSGDWNSGDWNSGHRNSGHRNSGDWNSGHRNSGDWNSGDWNSGHRNSGHRNSGDWNSGDWNSGNQNSGDWNSGDGNSGHRNSGHRNSGDWNSGHRNSGYMNRDTPPTVRVFERECKREVWDAAIKPNFLFLLPVTKWVSLADMTDKEKEAHPSSKTTGGYLKTLGYKEAWAVAWSKRGPNEEAQLRALPNFDAEIFKDITGIDVDADSQRDKDIADLEEKVQQMQAKLEEMKGTSRRADGGGD